MRRLIMLFIVIGMLIGAGGCVEMATSPFTPYAVPLILAVAILKSNLDAPVELDNTLRYPYEGRAWFVEPNEPSIIRVK